jgi:hypothetical protein
MSVQYMLARRNFDDPTAPRRHHFGFIGSSDVHSARPGTGYKEVSRRGMTDATGPRADAPAFLQQPEREPEPRARSVDAIPAMPFADRDTERGTSFLTTGGLVAVHATGRDRDAIWQALERREVYGTSGERILLWFDLLNGPDAGEHPMGSRVEMRGAPRFRVRASGAFAQQPGCPDYSVRALDPERLRRLCRGECYHPSDRRRRIMRIEVVRIRPQVRDDEPIATLVEDPWRTFGCPAEQSGCSVEFDDPEFAAAARHTLYYVRAIQEPTDAVNGANLRCTRDREGSCVAARPCYGSDARTPYEEDCLAPIEERAWSSPIYVDFSSG